MARFRSKLALELGRDSPQPPRAYAGITDLIAALHERDGGQAAIMVESASRRVLCSLFPNWPPLNPPGTVGLLHWFGVLFAAPFPVFSARLNAWVTWSAAQWLMGRCEVSDVDDPADVARLVAGSGRGQLLRVCRCRYLEETKCASICVNTCKMPTQAFFNEDMHVALTIVPNYETFECQFKFGVPPSADDEADAREIACFSECPSRRAARAHAALAAASALGGLQGGEVSAPRCASMGGS
ncbi:hypothetical protein KFE25_001555 [Diacronema lutheri]|uniref:Beta-carotene isomerase D27-like C-terminal domain-containing protein n=1 Tax=Diacronema lutheri TaxID=2081491 RepID=A0A8J5X823_DIALT|nr:hypothetical protein KFE25_001555 [Diacronema lutheri]